MNWPNYTEIAQFLTPIAVVISAMISVRNGRKLDTTNRKIEEVHKATNGMQAAMLKSAGIEGEAKGRADEKANPTA